jgi:hypothetical protein
MPEADAGRLGGFEFKQPGHDARLARDDARHANTIERGNGTILRLLAKDRKKTGACPGPAVGTAGQGQLDGV